MLRANKKVKGIQVNSMEHLLSMFADDIDIYVQNTPACCQALMMTIKEFEALSGLKINYDKSTVYRLGSAKRSRAKDIALKKHWSEGPPNILGVIVNGSESHDLIWRENIVPLLKKAKVILNTWRMRDLSLLGSILICNTLVSSLFTYRLAVLPKIPTVFISEYNEVVQNFIWKGRKVKIPFKVLQGNKKEGGLRLVDLDIKDKALKVQWVFRVIKDELLRTLAYNMLDNKIGDLIWEVNLNKKDIKFLSKNEGFWIDVFEAWSEWTYEDPKTREHVRNQIIWLNSDIRIDDQPIFYKK